MFSQDNIYGCKVGTPCPKEDLAIKLINQNYLLNLTLKKSNNLKRFFFSAISHFSFCHAIDFKCSNQDDFFYAVPDTRCSSYYRCNAQKTKVVHECSPESKFDFYKQTCSRSPGNIMLLPHSTRILFNFFF